jgi:competence protein ComEA
VEERSGSTIAIWLVVAALAVIAGTRLLGGAHEAPPPVSLDPAPATSRTAERHAQVYVHVAGAVRQPGLIRVPPDTRVASALERAGGPTPRADLTLVNLAAKVQDGQQVIVPVRGAATGAGAAGAPATGAAAPPGAKIHLSSATAEQLDEVDGIGPTLADRIVAYRDAHGGLRSLDELAEVDGIGEKRLATLREALQP